jgi:hypothetical protein
MTIGKAHMSFRKTPVMQLSGLDFFTALDIFRYRSSTLVEDRIVDSLIVGVHFHTIPEEVLVVITPIGDDVLSVTTWHLGEEILDTTMLTLLSDLAILEVACIS